MQTPSLSVESTANGTDETWRPTELRKSSEERKETPSTESPGLPMPADVASLIPLSFINESSELLLKLQRGLSRDVEEPNFRMNHAKVNAICNCAKQLASLQRLKIEAYRAISKANKE